tara:strand:+ start:1875 stop:2006 length:132 start_codon:yes stop_codon:yes gene_type:complete
MSVGCFIHVSYFLIAGFPIDMVAETDRIGDAFKHSCNYFKSQL